MGSSSQNSLHCSWCVVIRFSLKLAVFSARQLPLSRSLNHWGETLLLGLVSHLANGVLDLG